MRRGQRRLAQEILVGRPGGGLRMSSGEVVGVLGGAAQDGRPLCTINWADVNIDVPYLSSYIPAVGDVVLLLVQPPQIVVVGRLVGTP